MPTIEERFVKRGSGALFTVIDGPDPEEASVLEPRSRDSEIGNQLQAASKGWSGPWGQGTLWGESSASVPGLV